MPRPPENTERQDLARFVQENGLGFLNGVFEKSLGKKLPVRYAKRRPRRDSEILGMHARVGPVDERGLEHTSEDKGPYPDYYR